jgi:membrane-bound serine protease (ClpP class)
VIGVGCLAGSGLLLFDTGSDDFEVSIPVVVTVAVALGAFVLFAAERALKARKNPVLTGWEELAGSPGEVRVPLAPVGQVFVQGALWRATAAEGAGDAGAARLRERGARVRVEAVEGLTLRVRALEDEDPEAEE